MPRPTRNQNWKNNTSIHSRRFPLSRKKIINGVKLSPDVLKQQRARSFFESMKSKLSLKAVREIGTGVDFAYTFFRGKEKKSLQFDLKFSYGQLGEHVIKIRLSQRRLLNNADWAMAVGKNNEIEFFPIKALNEYITRNYSTVSKHLINKGTYAESAISLTEFYAKMGITPVKATLKIESIAEAIRKITEIEYPSKKELTQPKPSFVMQIRKQQAASTFLDTKKTLDKLTAQDKRAVARRIIPRTTNK